MIRMVDDKGSNLCVNSDSKMVYLQVRERGQNYAEYFRLNREQAMYLAHYISNVYMMEVLSCNVDITDDFYSNRNDKPVFGVMESRTF